MSFEGSSVLTTMASGRFFTAASGEGKISMIFPSKLLCLTSANAQHASRVRVAPKISTSNAEDLKSVRGRGRLIQTL